MAGKLPNGMTAEEFIKQRNAVMALPDNDMNRQLKASVQSMWEDYVQSLNPDLSKSAQNAALNYGSLPQDTGTPMKRLKNPGTDTTQQRASVEDNPMLAYDAGWSLDNRDGWAYRDKTTPIAIVQSTTNQSTNGLGSGDTTLTEYDRNRGQELANKAERANAGVQPSTSNLLKTAGTAANNILNKAVGTVKNTASAIGNAGQQPPPPGPQKDDNTPKPGTDDNTPKPGAGNGNGGGNPTGGSNPTPTTTTTPTMPAAQQQTPAGTQPLAQTLQPLQAGQPAYDAPPAAYDPASYAAYQQALNVLLDAQGNAPTYANPYETQLQNAYDAIVNRPKFQYDLNEDMLYRQYAQNYQNLGRLAMQDTMGQAAALTGGYGSSYGQAVGQQQYNAYLQQLNNIVPELYQQAYQQYRDEGNDLLNQYSILDAMADKDYGRYQDDYNRWLQNRNFAADMENQAYNRGLNEWRDAQDIYNRDRAFDNQQLQADRDYQMGLAQLNYNMANSDREYQMALDKWNYQKEQDALAQAAAEQAAAGGSGGSGTRVGYDKHGYTEEMIKDLQRQAGLKETGVWGENEKQAYKAGIRATNDPNKIGNSGTGAAAGNGAGPGVTTYSEAVAYMKNNNIPLRAIDDENKTITPDNLYTKQRWMAGKAAWLAGKEGKVTGNNNPALAYDNPAFAFDSYEDYLNGMIAYSQRNM